jgi:uncharacterized protein (TIGR03084 family)
MAADIGGMLTDLAAESADLDAMVAAAGPEALSVPTPAEGWDVADTVGHLWYFDREGRRAIEDPVGFQTGVAELLADPNAFEAILEETRRLDESLMSAWREERRLIIEALRGLDPKTRLPWYGPPMSPMSFGTARLMETWAHGQDIADALGVRRTATDRLRHIAHLGVATRGFSYAARGLEPSTTPVYVALTAPSGDEWTWGEPSAADSVRGPALDFCLLVTQRRLLDELDLEVVGDAAKEWLSIAQAFAGPPTETDPTRAALPTLTNQ